MHVMFQHTVSGSSGLPADRYVNTFHFVNGGAFTTNDLQAISGAIQGFYTALNTKFSSVIGSNVRTIKAYDMADTIPRAPVFEQTNTFGTAGAGAMPNELAICLSYKGAALSGAIPARRRGRIYLGPLTTNLYDATDGTSTDVRISSTHRSAILTAAVACRAAAFTNGGGAVWSVYSRRDETTIPIATFMVDDAFDVQRRRGLAPTIISSVAAV